MIGAKNPSLSPFEVLECRDTFGQVSFPVAALCIHSLWSARAAEVARTVAARRTRRMHPGAIDASPGRLAVVLFWANGLQGNFLRVKSASNELCSMIHCKVERGSPAIGIASLMHDLKIPVQKTSMASVL